MEKSKFMMIIILVLLVVLLGTVVTVSMYVLNLVKSQAEMTDAGGARKDTPTKNLSMEEIITVSLGDPITTNLSKGSDGLAHYAKIGVLVAYDNTVKKESDAFGEVFNQQLDYARAIALACIYSVTFDDIATTDGKAELANTIKEKLQNAFDSNLIVDVIFKEWTIT